MSTGHVPPPSRLSEFYDDFLHVVSIPIGRIKLTAGEVALCKADLSEGHVSKSDGPINVVYNSAKDIYYVDDGVHRVVQAKNDKAKTIQAKLLKKPWNRAIPRGFILGVGPEFHK